LYFTFSKNVWTLLSPTTTPTFYRIFISSSYNQYRFECCLGKDKQYINNVEKMCLKKNLVKFIHVSYTHVICRCFLSGLRFFFLRIYSNEFSLVACGAIITWYATYNFATIRMFLRNPYVYEEKKISKTKIHCISGLEKKILFFLCYILTLFHFLFLFMNVLVNHNVISFFRLTFLQIMMSFNIFV